VTRWILAIGLAGCAEYEVVLEQVSETPLEVHVGDVIELPAGILVTVEATGYRNGNQLDRDVEIDLDVNGVDVIDVSRTADEIDDDLFANFAIVGVAPGEAEILPSVDGHPTEAIPVVVTEQ
jgi:hypothetical protein